MVVLTKTAEMLFSGMTRPECEEYLKIPNSVRYVDNPLFHRADAEEVIFGQGENQIPPINWSWRTLLPAEEDTDPDSWAPTVVLTREQEVLLFLRHNYAKLRLSLPAAAQKKNGWSLARARQMLFWHRRAQEARTILVEANLPFVFFKKKEARRAPAPFWDLISDGYLALLRCIDKFDVSREFRFSTYLGRALLKAFEERKRMAWRDDRRRPISLDSAPEPRERNRFSDIVARRDRIRVVRKYVCSEARLSPMERLAVTEHFGIGKAPGRTSQTLRQIAAVCGTNQQEVLLAQKRAIRKMRRKLAKML